MANTIDWIHGHIYYFISLFILISLFSFAGVFTENQVVTDARFRSSLSGSFNQTNIPDTSSTAFSWGNFFKDIFSFFFFNISFYGNDILMQYLWIFRMIFVYVPLLSLLITLYYSLPLVGGG